MTISGVVLTALYRAESAAVSSPEDGPDSINETVEGIIMALSAAACFGMFSCLFKKWVVDDKHGGVVFGSFGVVAFFIGIPLIVISNYSGLQEFVLPDYKVWLVVTADATMCCFVNNVCLSRAFIYLTPVIVLVGLSMTIPLSIFVDAVIFANHTYSTLNIIGITIITISVLIVGWDQATFEKSMNQKEADPTKREKTQDPTAPALNTHEM
jgi:drug/metabolite transporter (DMT)-like permease